MRRLRLGTLVATIFLLVAGVASAGEVFVPKKSPLPAPPSVFRAGPGEVNNLTVVGNGATHRVEFVDSLALLTAGTGCEALADGSVSCNSGVFDVEVYLKDLDDTANVKVPVRGSVWAGPGNDNVFADAFGAFTLVYGEGGDDNITAGGEGGQLADGGPGNDVVHAGGWAGSGTGLGGTGNDVIYFHTHVGGMATLDGGNGDDTIISQPTWGTATGGDGDDIIVIDGDRAPFGAGSGLALSGGGGADTIVGGRFDDTIDAGADRDYIDVLDGGADTVNCGSGSDVVRFDATDTVAADCEILLGPTS